LLNPEPVLGRAHAEQKVLKGLEAYTASLVVGVVEVERDSSRQEAGAEALLAMRVGDLSLISKVLTAEKERRCSRRKVEVAVSRCGRQR